MNINQRKTYALILNYNSSSESITLFKNLEEQQNVFLTILIIDNHSNEKERKQLLNNIPDRNLIFNKKNLGYAAGNNIGIQIALNENADFVWILNPDVRVEKNTLSILINTIKNDKTLAAVGPRIIQRENPGKIFSDGEKIIMDEAATTIHKNHNLDVDGLPTGIDYNIDYIAGSSILLNSMAIREIGNLPEEYFLYFEETDWCFKARKSNWELAINSNSQVRNLTSAKTAIFHYYFMRNRLVFCKKYHPDYRIVRNYYLKDIIGEIFKRLNGRFLRPYFKSRSKGLISGIIKTGL